MKNLAVCLLTLVCISTPLFAQEFTTAEVLAKLDERAKAFTSLEATLSNTQVDANVKAPTKSGKLSIKMDKSLPRMLWDVTEPKNEKTTYLIEKGRFVAWNRVTGSVTRKPVESNSDLLQLLVIGFGVPSATLTKNYAAEVKGRQAVAGTQTVVLELKSITPGTARFPKITLFLDPGTWSPARTRVVEKGALSGDYYDFDYSDIKLNKGVADSVFDVKFPK
jgi:outer membrane lipoprotein-sorting protein